MFANKKYVAMLTAAILVLAGCGPKDTQGQVAQYTGTAAYSGTNWTVETNDGEIAISFDGPFADGWTVDELAKNTKIESSDDNGYHFKVTKAGDGQLILCKDMNTDGCLNRQSLQINFTADSNKRMYNVEILPNIKNVPTKITDDDLKGLSEKEQDALYDTVSAENEACRVEFEKITGEGGTFTESN